MKVMIENLKRHVHVLASDIGSRNIREPVSLGRAQHYIHECFESSGLKVRVQSYEAEGNATANLIAHHAHADFHLPMWVLGAHYDTVPGTPGADDNASAVAVLLEVARLSALRAVPGGTGVFFAAFSTEEPPCFNTDAMGSRVFVDALRAEALRIEGALVMEMVGYYRDEPGTQTIPLPLKWLGLPDSGHFLAVVGNGISRALVKRIARGLEDSRCGLPFETLTIPGSGYLLPEARLSDNASFWDAGIPAVMLTDTSFFRNPHYHTHRDRPETLHYEKMSQLVLGLNHFFMENGK